jgi:hypothetical protein
MNEKTIIIVEEIECGNHENDIFVRPIKSLSTTVRAASMQLEV